MPQIDRSCARTDAQANPLTSLPESRPPPRSVRSRSGLSVQVKRARSSSSRRPSGGRPRKPIAPAPDSAWLLPVPSDLAPGPEGYVTVGVAPPLPRPPRRDERAMGSWFGWRPRCCSQVRGVESRVLVCEGEWVSINGPGGGRSTQWRMRCSGPRLERGRHASRRVGSIRGSVRSCGWRPPRAALSTVDIVGRSPS